MQSAYCLLKKPQSFDHKMKLDLFPQASIHTNNSASQLNGLDSNQECNLICCGARFFLYRVQIFVDLYCSIGSVLRRYKIVKWEIAAIIRTKLVFWNMKILHWQSLYQITALLHARNICSFHLIYFLLKIGLCIVSVRQ